MSNFSKVFVFALLVTSGHALAQVPGPLSPTSWTPIGPRPLDVGTTDNTGNVSGRITGIAAHPTNSDILYVSTAGGGVWRTANATAAANTIHWTPLTDGKETLSLGAIALAASNPAMIYAGSGEANNSRTDTNYGLGIFVSKDVGGPWVLSKGPGDVFFKDRLAISQVAVDPSNPLLAFAAMANKAVNGVCFTTGRCANTGIWRTKDGGVNWENTTTVVESSRNWSAVAIDPFSPVSVRTVYGAVGERQINARSGVYKSTRGGDLGSWTACPDLTGVMAPVAERGRIAIALAKTNGQVMYVTIARPTHDAAGNSIPNGGELRQVLLSRDGCRTFEDITRDAAGNVVNYMGVQGWYDTTVIVDPVDPGVVYVAGASQPRSILRNSNFGQVWTIIGGSAVRPPNPNPHADHHGIDFDASGNRLLDGSDGGIYALENPRTCTPASCNWKNLNGDLETIQFMGIGLHPNDSKRAIGGSHDNGTEVFAGTLLWKETWDGDGGFAKFSQTPVTVGGRKLEVGKRAYRQGNDTQELLSSDDSGDTWNSGVDFSNTSGLYQPFIVDPEDGDHVLYGTDRIWESRGGVLGAWNSVPFNLGAVGKIDAIALAPSNKDRIYFSAHDPRLASNRVTGQIFVTPDHGVTWSTFNVPAPPVDPLAITLLGGTADNSVVKDLQVDPTDQQRAYAVINRFRAGGNVLMTDNGGATWSSIHGPGLPEAPVWSVQIDPADPAGTTLYAGADDGVYVTHDRGATWSRMGTGLPRVQVFQIELNPRLRILGAGTHGRSMWEIMASPLTDLIVIKEPAGTFVRGNNATFKITVKNVGGIASNGPVTVTDVPGPGLSLVAMTGAGWACGPDGGLSLGTCTRATPLPPNGASEITVTVAVSATADNTVRNSATVSGGNDSNLNNNTSTATADVAGIVLAITKTPVPAQFNQGQMGASYTIRVTNVGTAATAGLVTVTDSWVPAADLALVGMTAPPGSWTCWPAAALPPGTCTIANPLPAGQNFPDITVTVNVSPTAGAGNLVPFVPAGFVDNTAIVQGGGDLNAHSVVDHTPIGMIDLTIAKAPTSAFLRGFDATYRLTVWNAGKVPVPVGTVITVTDAPIPPGLTLKGMAAPAPWACGALGPCTYGLPAPLPPLAGLPPITVTVSVAANANPVETNTATVTTPGDFDKLNDTDAFLTVIGSAVSRTQPGLDCVTGGNWKGKYGSDGYIIANDAFNPPITLTQGPPNLFNIFTGTQLHQWAATTTDPRALLKAASATDRIAAAYVSTDSSPDDNFIVDVKFTDGKHHQVALYFLDYDTFARVQQITFFNGEGPGELADPATVSNFHGGCYLPFDVQGHVVVRVSRIAGSNAVLSGVFFDSAIPPDLPSVFMTQPANPVVSGIVTLAATASSPAGMASIQFQLTKLLEPGGYSTVNLGPPVLGPGPNFTMQWSSFGFKNQSYTLTAVATDQAARTFTSPGVAVSLNNAGPAAPSAVFVKSDAVTKGNWKGAYGADGNIIANDSNNLPAYASAGFSSVGQYTWAGSTSELRALIKGASADRIASTFYSAVSNIFDIDLNLVDLHSHQVALYLLDWDNAGRVENITVMDANINAVLDTRAASNFSGGIYLVWNMQGHLRIRITRVSGPNGVVSGIFLGNLSGQPPPTVAITAPVAAQNVSGLFTLSANASAAVGGSIVSVQFQLDGANLGAPVTTGPPYSLSWASTTTSNGSHMLVAVATDNLLQQTASAPVTFTVSNGLPTSVVFVASDNFTKGSWKGHYGSDGEIIANDSSSMPAYGSATLNGASPFTWVAATSATQALQQASGANRIASTFYAVNSFTIDVNLIDGLQHQIALYFLDWDNGGRVQTVKVVDAATLTVLDAQTVSNFLLGQYLVWNVKGHVLVQITRTAGTNAVVSGVFLGPP